MGTSTINFQDAFIGGYKADISSVAQYGGQYSQLMVQICYNIL